MATRTTRLKFNSLMTAPKRGEISISLSEHNASVNPFVACMRRVDGITAVTIHGDYLGATIEHEPEIISANAVLHEAQYAINLLLNGGHERFFPLRDGKDIEITLVPPAKRQPILNDYLVTVTVTFNSDLIAYTKDAEVWNTLDEFYFFRFTADGIRSREIGYRTVKIVFDTRSTSTRSSIKRLVRDYLLELAERRPDTVVKIFPFLDDKKLRLSYDIREGAL